MLYMDWRSAVCIENRDRIHAGGVPFTRGMLARHATWHERQSNETGFNSTRVKAPLLLPHGHSAAQGCSSSSKHHRHHAREARPTGGQARGAKNVDLRMKRHQDGTNKGVEINEGSIPLRAAHEGPKGPEVAGRTAAQRRRSRQRAAGGS